jgi:hypothetical protein
MSKRFRLVPSDWQMLEGRPARTSSGPEGPKYGCAPDSHSENGDVSGEPDVKNQKTSQSKKQNKNKKLTLKVIVKKLNDADLKNVAGGIHSGPYDSGKCSCSCAACWGC